MEIPKNKFQKTNKSQLPKFKIPNLIIVKKGKRTGKDIFINTEKIGIVKIIVIWDSRLPLAWCL
ncbi:MAG: hypothetical protein BA867_05540 [Desulfobacterales bacterium S5133MH16]|nr:MAG: hypothetical protein BA867_05540 [Desulfobacterales bacterium S5133MH16]